MVTHNQFPGSQTNDKGIDNSRSCDVRVLDGGLFSTEGDDLMCDEKDIYCPQDLLPRPKSEPWTQ